MFHPTSSDSNALVKRILVMCLLSWGLLIVAVTDHPHPSIAAQAAP